jgi:adenylate kinase
VGKGTQAALLEQRFGVKQFSSGAIFRQELDANTDLGRLARKYMEAGELVPDDVTIGMMASRLSTDSVKADGFILDGFPRTVEQAAALDKLLAELGTPLDAVVSIEIDDEIVVGRLSGRLSCPQCGEIFHRDSKPPMRDMFCDNCGGALSIRKDDVPETIRERLKTFHANTAPVVGYYERTGKLVRVDGALSAEGVFTSLVAKLGA